MIKTAAPYHLKYISHINVCKDSMTDYLNEEIHFSAVLSYNQLFCSPLAFHIHTYIYLMLNWTIVFIRVIIIYSEWQWFSWVSGRSLSYHLLPDVFSWIDWIQDLLHAKQMFTTVSFCFLGLNSFVLAGKQGKFKKPHSGYLNYWTNHVSLYLIVKWQAPYQ